MKKLKSNKFNNTISREKGLRQRLHHFFTFSLFHSFTANARRSQSGAGLLDVILAIAIVAAITPFVYNRIAETSREIKDVSSARAIISLRDRFTGYVRKNQSEWVSNAETEIGPQELASILPPLRDFTAEIAFVEKYSHSGGIVIETYVVLRPIDMDLARVFKIADNLGADAAVADDSGGAFSMTGGWFIESGSFLEGDLIFRIVTDLGNDNSAIFLHRMKSDDDVLNTMERDLSMSRHNLLDADFLSGGVLDAKSVRAWFANADIMIADDLRFLHGADLDASSAAFNSIRVAGDIVGFRQIAADNVQGASMNASWSNTGRMIAGTAIVTGAVHVGRNLVMRSASAKVIAGFAGASANSLAVPFIATDYLRFADGYGLTISSELIVAGGPLQLGSWNFPSDPAPKFHELNLQRYGNVASASGAPTGFEKILTAGWK